MSHPGGTGWSGPAAVKTLARADEAQGIAALLGLGAQGKLIETVDNPG